MINRVIDISESSVFLRFENKLLIVKAKEKRVTIPVSDIAALIISNPAVTLTHAVLSELASAGCIIVVCDRKHLPSGILMPTVTNSIQTERTRLQVNSSIPKNKSIWQQIVRCKIANQAFLLMRTNGNEYGLKQMVSQVKSGDATNIEAKAAQRYWSKLEMISKRDRCLHDNNVYLNYGYAVLHALTARSVCAAGLHPSIGVNHHNKYNPFCLASDIMEPFRPIVDYSVYKLQDWASNAELNKVTKAHLINSILESKFIVNNEKISIFKALEKLISSIVNIFAGKGKRIVNPKMVL